MVLVCKQYDQVNISSYSLATEHSKETVPAVLYTRSYGAHTQIDTCIQTKSAGMCMENVKHFKRLSWKTVTFCTLLNFCPLRLSVCIGNSSVRLRVGSRDDIHEVIQLVLNNTLFYRGQVLKTSQL